MKMIENIGWFMCGAMSVVFVGVGLLFWGDLRD